MNIIAFSGGYGVGKTTAINHLKDCNIFKEFVNVKFAQPLYDIQDFVYKRVASAYRPDASFVKDRKLLQWLGTEWGRGVNENLWVDLWKQAVKGVYSRPGLRLVDSIIITCDDCRYDNEAETIKSLGGIIIKLTSVHAEDRNTAKNGIAGHASEAGISDKYIDFTVRNDSTKQDFQRELETIYGQIVRK